MSQPASVPPGGTAQPPGRRWGILRVLAVIASGFVGFVALLGGCIVMLTQGVTEAGNRFLADVTGPEPALAWRSAGPDLQSKVSEADFLRWVANRHLQGGTVGTWSNRSRNNADGALQGTMTLRDGGTIRFRLILRQNAAGTWQVIGVSTDGHSETGGEIKA